MEGGTKRNKRHADQKGCECLFYAQPHTEEMCRQAAQGE